MALPLTALQKITDFAGWGSSGMLVACGKGSADVVELRRIRTWIRAGFHGLAIPWTSLKSIADFAGIPGAAQLGQTERGYDMMKLLRLVTFQTIVRNHWADIARSWGAIDRQAIERRVDASMDKLSNDAGLQGRDSERTQTTRTSQCGDNGQGSNNGKHLSAQQPPRPAAPISGDEEKADGRHECGVGQHKVEPKFWHRRKQRIRCCSSPTRTR